MCVSYFHFPSSSARDCLYPRSIFLPRPPAKEAMNIKVLWPKRKRKRKIGYSSSSSSPKVLSVVSGWIFFFLFYLNEKNKKKKEKHFLEM